MKSFRNIAVSAVALCLAAGPALSQQQGPYGPGPAPSSGGSVPAPVNVSTLTNHGVVVGQGASAIVASAAGSAGQVLTSNGASADPTFQAAGSSPLATAAVSGNWYQPPFVTQANGSAATASRMVCVENVNLVTGLTVKGLVARTFAAGTTNTQLAVYANSGGFPNGAPLGSTGNLLNTSANTNIGFTGDVTNFSLPVGPYWDCVVSNDATVSFLSVSAGSSGAGASSLTGSATLANLLVTGGIALIKEQAITFGTWPTLTSAGWTEGSVVSQAAVVVKQAN